MKIIYTCCVVVALCFAVIAYSQFQSQKAQWQLVEAQKMRAAAELLSNSHVAHVMRAEFLRRIEQGWDPKDALQYAFDHEDVAKPHLKELLNKEGEDAVKWAKQYLQEAEQKK